MLTASSSAIAITSLSVGNICTLPTGTFEQRDEIKLADMVLSMIFPVLH